MGQGEAIRILVVDDRTVTRTGYRALFEGNPGLAVVADAGDAQHAGRCVSNLDPNVVVLDWHSQSVDAVETVRCITAGGRASPPPVLVLLDEFDDRVHRLLRVGVRGLLLNRSSPEEIVSAVRLVAAGYSLLFPGQRCGVEPLPLGGQEQVADNVYLGCLTRREADVLRLIAQGCSNAEISAALFVSESTVKSHVQRMLDKLELRNRVHAVIYAYEVGMVQARNAGTLVQAVS